MQRQSVMYKIGKLIILVCLCSAVSFPVRGEVSRTKKHYLEGENYVIGGRYRKALGKFRKLRRWYPRSKYASKSLFQTGRCYEGLGRPKKAERYYIKFLTSWPEIEFRNEALYRLGEMFRGEGKYKKMLFYTRLLVISNPPKSEWVEKVSGQTLWQKEAGGKERLKDITLDEKGNVYVLVTREKGEKLKGLVKKDVKIQKYSPEGKLLKEITLQRPPTNPLYKAYKNFYRDFFYRYFRCLTVDRKGNFYIGHDPLAVIKYDAKGNYIAESLKHYGNPNINTEGLQAGSDGLIYVADFNGRILVLNPNCEILEEIKTEGSLFGIDLDTNNNMYVSGGGVGIINRLTKKQISFGDSNPSDLAVDSFGNIYTADYTRISVFDSFGRYLDEIGNTSSKIQVNKKNGLIYSIDSSNKCLKVFSPSRYFYYAGLGNKLQPEPYAFKGHRATRQTWRVGLFDEPLRYYFQGIQLIKENKLQSALPYLEKALQAQPEDVHLLLATVRVYLYSGLQAQAKEILQRIIRLYPQRLEPYLKLAQIYVQEKDYDEGVKVYEQALESITDLIKVRLLKRKLLTLKEEKELYPKVKLKLSWQPQGWHSDNLPQYELTFVINIKGLKGYRSRLTTDSSDRIIVTDTVNNRIKIFSPQGDFLSQFKLKYRPNGIAADSRDRIIVSNDCGRYIGDAPYRLQIFSLEGELLKSFGRTGFGEGELGANSFLSLAVTEDDEIVVADNENFKIRIFNEEGRLLRSFTYSPKYLNSKIALDRNRNIYVFADNKVRIYNFQGEYVDSIPARFCSDGVISNDVLGINRGHFSFYSLKTKELIGNIGKVRNKPFRPFAVTLDSQNRLITVAGTEKIYVLQPKN